MRILGLAVLLSIGCAAGCGGKKKAAPPEQGAAEPAGSAKLAPVLQPTENKLEGAMQKESDRATPDPETSGTTGQNGN